MASLDLVVDGDDIVACLEEADALCIEKTLHRCMSLSGTLSSSPTEWAAAAADEHPSAAPGLTRRAPMQILNNETDKW